MTIKMTDSPVMGRIWAVLTALLLSYAGYDQYEKSQATTETTVNVNLESVPDDVVTHSHGPVLSRMDVETLINQAVAAQHEKNLQTFKQLEEWERN